MPRFGAGGGRSSRGFGASGAFPGGRGSAVDILGYAAQERIVSQYLYEHAGVPVDGTNGTYAHIAPPGALLIDVDNKTLYQNTNTQASPTWTLRSASGGGSGLQPVTVPISSAELLALHTTLVELVPAQGAGTVVVPRALWFDYTAGASAYADGSDLQIGWWDGSTFTEATRVSPTYAGLDGTENVSGLLVASNALLNNPDALRNHPLVVRCATAFTAGDGALAVTVDGVVVGA